jgi:curved DNA-binding protein
MSNSSNLYEVLGVEQTATLEEIKKAYRKLARLYHPDKAGSDPSIAAKFTEITRAYEILSDEEKRAQYHRTTRKRVFYRRTWRPPGGYNFSEQSQESKKTNRRPQRKAWKKKENNLNLDDLFTHKGNRPKPKPSTKNARTSGAPINGNDISIEVEITEIIAKHGGTSTIEYRRNRRGDGLDVQPMDEIFHLRVPPNTRHGQVLMVDKMGHSGANGGVSGNLHCRVKLVPTVTTQRYAKTNTDKDFGSDSNIDIEIPITFPEAVLGTRIRVVTPTGKLLVSIPARSSSGRKLRLRGRGKNGSDFIIGLRIIVPEHLDDNSVDLVQKFAELNPVSPRDEE